MLAVLPRPPVVHLLCKYPAAMRHYRHTISTTLYEALIFLLTFGNE